MRWPLPAITKSIRLDIEAIVLSITSIERHAKNNTLPTSPQPLPKHVANCTYAYFRFFIICSIFPLNPYPSADSKMVDIYGESVSILQHYTPKRTTSIKNM